jgi:CRP-like cAMP-binding protein
MEEVERSSEKGSVTMSRLMFLKTVPLFEGLSLDDILSVDEIMFRKDFGAGETIVAQGDPGTSLFVLYSGTAAVRLGQGESAKLVTELQAGSYFGEMTLFDDQPRSASVVAQTNCTLLSLDRDRFRTLVAQRPIVLMQICKTFGARLRETNRQLLAS